jgi:hypothetical protein
MAMTKREWQIEMANRFAKRDNVKELAEKLECYERLADASEMASNPMGVKSRVALRNVREMKIKTVTMRCKDYDVALPIIYNDFGRVLVGQVSIPPQRTWVGLTDDEKQDAYLKIDTWNNCVDWIEDKLKDKNT